MLRRCAVVFIGTHVQHPRDSSLHEGAFDSTLAESPEHISGRLLGSIRAHKPDGSPIEVTAKVIRIAPAIYGTARVGVQIAEPTENWLRLFVSWVADEQPTTSESENEQQ